MACERDARRPRQGVDRHAGERRLVARSLGGKAGTWTNATGRSRRRRVQERGVEALVAEVGAGGVGDPAREPLRAPGIRDRPRPGRSRGSAAGPSGSTGTSTGWAPSLSGNGKSRTLMATRSTASAPRPGHTPSITTRSGATLVDRAAQCRGRLGGGHGRRRGRRREAARCSLPSSSRAISPLGLRSAPRYGSKPVTRAVGALRSRSGGREVLATQCPAFQDCRTRDQWDDNVVNLCVQPRRGRLRTDRGEPDRRTQTARTPR